MAKPNIRGVNKAKTQTKALGRIKKNSKNKNMWRVTSAT